MATTPKKDEAPKEISVMALDRGQKPDRTWAKRGERFNVPVEKFSENWMKKV